MWAECNISEAKARGIPILRRFSGGGTVYHDLGNVNYSLHRDKSLFNRTFGAEMIIRALKQFEGNLFLSARHDIFLKMTHGSSAKVSGSAYKLSRDRAYHHGTLLLSTDLEKIAHLLKSPHKIVMNDENFKFGGVSSVPSPVTNINLDYEKFIQLIQEEFKPDQIHQVSEESDRNEEILGYEGMLESWDWTFAKSPSFKVEIDGRVLVVEAGIIRESGGTGNIDLIGTKQTIEQCAVNNVQ